MSQLPELAETYYLDHFYEFIGFIEATSAHLLTDSAEQFIAKFHALSKPAKCMLVRIANRKYAFVAKSSLQYKEIEQPNDALTELRREKLIARIGKHELNDCLSVLNKQELIELAEGGANLPKQSAKKATWLTYCQGHLQYNAISKHPVLQNYIYFAARSEFNYLLYLFFGHSGGHLNQFSLRDLGIVKTASGIQNYQAHFSCVSDAKSAFDYSVLFNQVKDANHDDLQVLAKMAFSFAPPIGERAEQKYHHLLYKLASSCADKTLAHTLFERSLHPAAVEKYIRLLNNGKEHDTCQQKLNSIIEDPPSEHLLLFAEDFLARKYKQKRTSILTDMLRQSKAPILLDEAYLGQTELGVKHLYTLKGKQVIFSENQLWRALFALTFWPIIFNSASANEFDHRPQALKLNQFYQQHQAHIDTCLAELTSSDIWLTRLLKHITQHYGHTQWFFTWHNELYNHFKLLLQNAELDSLKQQLVFMANDFKGLSDGYPDLLVIDETGLRFEELKAPGDTLRRNQLVIIKKLKQAGFNVTIQATDWHFDPNQAYVVVDIETTGGQKEYHRVTEVGMVKIQNGKVVDSWQSLVNPERHIPKAITQLTGIDDDMVKHAPRFADIAEHIAQFSDNAIFVAHNVNFDYGFLRQEFARIGINYKRAKQCTVKLARQYLPGYASYALGKLCAELQINLENHHRALDDAKAAAEILLRINDARLIRQASTN
jgi:DNA polymerase-3 subunit epsilon